MPAQQLGIPPRLSWPMRGVPYKCKLHPPTHQVSSQMKGCESMNDCYDHAIHLLCSWNRLRHCVLHAHPPYLYLYKSCFPNTTCPISIAYHSLTLSTPYSLISSSEETLNGVPNTNFHTHWPHICWPLIISSNSSFCHLIISSFPQKEYIFLMGMDCVLCFSSVPKSLKTAHYWVYDRSYSPYFCKRR